MTSLTAYDSTGIQRPLRASSTGTLLGNVGTLVARTGVSAVALGGPSAGWVSGNPASLAISTAVTAVFDLGPDWAQYGLLMLNVKGTQPFTSIAAHYSDDGTTNAAPVQTAGGTGPLNLALSAAGDVAASALPSGRYLRVVLTNSTVAQGATAGVRLTAYPN